MINNERQEQKDVECREYFSRDWGIYFPWFRAYNLGMKEWLSWINEGRPETQGSFIPVIFATPERAFADFVRPRVEGQVDLPVISFALTAINFDQARFKPSYLPFNRRKIGDKWQLIPRSMPWDINYNVTVWSRFYETLDIVSYALLSRFTPKSYLYANGAASEISFQGHSDSSTLEPGADQDRVLRHDYQFKVNGWMPMPYKEVGSIRDIIIWITNELNGEKTIDEVLEENGGMNEDGVTVITDFSDTTISNPSPNKITGIYEIEQDLNEQTPSNVPQLILAE